ncbi:DUF397 domain-containing protein [Nocardiopsis dassonvillei]|uniref:DUF397 domain-containing protein n=1 Tax=Nocardiopsis dassonvillei TaxID=2014 RepID=UPI00157CE066|nr:DUF397 domain-containing protein [Nocardiopsis dassonvillei]
MTLNEWRKSSYSAGQSACVEISTDEESSTAMRDTKHRELGALLFDRTEWHAFIRGTKNTHH